MLFFKYIIVNSMYKGENKDDDDDNDDDDNNNNNNNNRSNSRLISICII